MVRISIVNDMLAILCCSPGLRGWGSGQRAALRFENLPPRAIRPRAPGASLSGGAVAALFRCGHSSRDGGQQLIGPLDLVFDANAIVEALGFGQDRQRLFPHRSEERRVGKECVCTGSPRGWPS